MTTKSKRQQRSGLKVERTGSPAPEWVRSDTEAPLFCRPMPERNDLECPDGREGRQLQVGKFVRTTRGGSLWVHEHVSRRAKP